MAFRIMSIKLHRKVKDAAFTLVELLVAVGLFGITSMALCTTYYYSARGFASLANYGELDKINRIAMDTLTQEIRQARLVTDVATNSFSIINGDGLSVTYWFNPSLKQFVRTCSDGTSRVLVSSCSLISFDVFQRNTIAGTWDQ